MGKKKKADAPKTIVNRKASHDYNFLDKYEAGIVLTGTEVKAIRQGKANLTDAYCMFDKHGNLMLLSMHISEYDHGNIYNHATRRERRLLLNKRELKKIQRAITEKGKTIIPYKIYFSARGFIKVEIHVAEGKRQYDKRNTLKDKENKRNLDRVMKAHR